MKLRNLLFLTILSLFVISCNVDGCSSENESSNNENNSAQSDDIDLDNVEKELNDAKDALTDLFSDGKKDGEKVEVINWRELKDLLPNRLAGMRLDDENIEGQTTGMMGFKVSNTQGTYRNDDAKIEATILDFGGVGFLLKTVASFADAEIDSDTSDGYQKTTTYEGYKAFEEYNDRRNSGSFMVLVEDRFVVTVTGNDIEMDDLKDAIDDLNIKKLARMAK